MELSLPGAKVRGNESSSYHSAALILLDLSAAFDTVDYPILLQRLQTMFIRNVACEE